MGILSPTGMYLGMVSTVTTKYSFEIPRESLQSDVNRLTNQLWKLIPMRENEENWKEQLNSVLIEVSGLGEIFNTNEKFLILLSKLEGLKITEISFGTYRKTVFESISLLREILHD